MKNKPQVNTGCWSFKFAGCCWNVSMLFYESFQSSILCRQLLGSAMLWLRRCSLHWPSKSSGVTSFCKTSLQALKFDLIDKLLTRVNCRATGIAKTSFSTKTSWGNIDEIFPGGRLQGRREILPKALVGEWVPHIFNFLESSSTFHAHADIFWARLS